MIYKYRSTSKIERTSMIEIYLFKDPLGKCIRWGYTVYSLDSHLKRTRVKGWEGPSVWYGKEFFSSFSLWKRQYR